jgi:hypothetical protein
MSGRAGAAGMCDDAAVIRRMLGVHCCIHNLLIHCIAEISVINPRSHVEVHSSTAHCTTHRRPTMTTSPSVRDGNRTSVRVKIIIDINTKS